MNFGAKKKPQAWAPGEEGRLKEHKPKKIWITQQKLPRPSTELSQPERYELPSYSQEVSNVAAANYMLSWAAEESVLQPTLSDTSQQSMGDKQCYLFIHYMIQKERVKVVYGKKKTIKNLHRAKTGKWQNSLAWPDTTEPGVCSLAQAPRCQQCQIQQRSVQSCHLCFHTLLPPGCACLCRVCWAHGFQQLNLSVWTNRCHLGRMSFSWLWFDPTKSNFQTLQAS